MKSQKKNQAMGANLYSRASWDKGEAFVPLKGLLGTTPGPNYCAKFPILILRDLQYLLQY